MKREDWEKESEEFRKGWNTGQNNPHITIAEYESQSDDWKCGFMAAALGQEITK